MRVEAVVEMKRVRFSHVPLAVALLVFTSMGTAVAQSGRQLLEVSRSHMEQGQDLYARGRYVEAAEEFLAAYQAREFSAFLFNAALCYERYGDPARAAALYERYLDREPRAADRADVLAKIAALRAQLAAASPPSPDTAGTPGTPAASGASGDSPANGPASANPPAGSGAGGPAPGSTGTAPSAPTAPAPSAEEMKSLLSVQTQPEGARVSILQGTDVIATGPSPFAHTLDEGEYRLRIEHPSYRTVDEPVRVRAGKVYMVIIEMSQAAFLGYLRVVSNPPGARVFVDDHEAGSHPAPYALQIPTGPHRIWIERAGFQTVEREVEVGLGEQVEVSVELERVDVARLRVVANVRPGDVYVDDARVGGIPFEGEVPAGRRHVRIRADGMKDWEGDLELQRGRTTPMRVRLRPAPERSNAYATLTLGTVLLGSGVALSVISHQLRGDLEAEQDAGTLAADDPRIRQGRILTIGADTSYGLAGFVGALSLYYFLHDSSPDSEATILEPRDWTMLPVLDPTTGTAALTVGGRF